MIGLALVWIVCAPLAYLAFQADHQLNGNEFGPETRRTIAVASILFAPAALVIAALSCTISLAVGRK